MSHKIVDYVPCFGVDRDRDRMECKSVVQRVQQLYDLHAAAATRAHDLKHDDAPSVLAKALFGAVQHSKRCFRRGSLCDCSHRSTFSTPIQLRLQMLNLGSIVNDLLVEFHPR